MVLGCPEHWTMKPYTEIRAKVYRIITIYTRPRQTDGRTDRQTDGRTSVAYCEFWSGVNDERQRREDRAAVGADGWVGAGKEMCPLP